MSEFKTERISQGQFYKLIIMIVLSTVFLTIPRRLAVVAEWDSPFALILGYQAAWLLGVIVIWLSSKYPNDTFVEYSKKILGPFLGWLFGFLAFIALANLSVLTIRVSGGLYITAGYSKTPIIVFSAVTVLLAVWILKEGVEVFARVAEVLFVPLIISIIFLFISITNKIELKNLLPVFSFGIRPILQGALLAFSTGVEHVFLIGILISKIQKLDKKIYKAHFYGIAMATFITLLIVVGTIGVFSLEDVKRFWMPPFQLAKVVEIGGFLTGIEIILLANWTIATLMEVAIFLYLSVTILSQLLNIKYRDVLLPFAYLLTTMSMAPMDVYQVEEEFQLINNYLMIPAAIIFCILHVPIYMIRKKFSKEKNKKGAW